MLSAGLPSNENGPLFMQNTAAEAHLNKLVSRSLQLEEELMRYFDFGKVGQSIRPTTTATMCSICFEHAGSLRLLIDARNFTTAVGVLRLQYEALVRTMWVYYAATDAAISKLSEELTPESEKSASRLPMMTEMLKQVENRAPGQIYEKLDEIRKGAWKSMNSFTHSGIHAVNRHEKGYPIDLINSMVKHSNGMSAIVAILFYRVIDEKRVEAVLEKVRCEFEGCLPINRG